MPKGFGSENMSQIRMFKPSAGLQGIKDFILEVVETAGPNPCPPLVVGVGIGGTFDKCALLAKKALMRPLNTENPDPYYADLEKEVVLAGVLDKVEIWSKEAWEARTADVEENIEDIASDMEDLGLSI